ncbi:MAG: DUF697 domain-containing protein [Bacteroidia bacterium]|nr:DUF697 domain-containing protein [Bacteroidia bacterium]MDW8133797.1 DUF697 domain-containing protein [Bacteroidia bacterium]
MEGKEQKADKLIREHMIAAMGAGLIPLPFADWATTTAVQLNLVRKLAELYEVPFLPGAAKGIIASLVGATAVRGGSTLVKLIPGVGWAIGGLTASVLAAGTTYALGKVLQNHFSSGGSLVDLNITAAQKAYQRAFEEGKKVSQELEKNSPLADPYEQLRKLHDLHKAGILTAEEYEAQKRRILERL